MQLYSDVASKLVNEVFTGKLRVDEGGIRECFIDLAFNAVCEQEIRKSLNSSSTRSPFDQSLYFTKLASLSTQILTALRKFKINVDTLRVLREPETSITREAWFKYQFLVLAMNFFKQINAHLSMKQTQPPVVSSASSIT